MTGDFGGLLHEFDNLDQAVGWAERCFREHCRLRIDSAGKEPFMWTLEGVTPSGNTCEWLASGSPLFVMLLARKSVRYLSNFIPAARAEDKQFAAHS